MRDNKALDRSRFSVMICLRGDSASHHFIAARPDSNLFCGSVNLSVIWRDNVNIDSINHALEQSNSWFRNVACYDFFCMTEMCCHVRFTMLEKTTESPERCLAWILDKGMQNYLDNWVSQPRNIELLELSSTELQDFLATQFAAIPRSEHTQNPWNPPMLLDDIAVADQIYRIYGINPYEYGPTDITCWWTSDRFFYVETHHES